MNTDKRAYSLYRKIMSATSAQPYFANASDVHDAVITANQFGTHYRFRDNSRLFIKRRDPDGMNELCCYEDGLFIAHGSKKTPIEPRTL